jgi:hydroxypyruvate isomerase
MSRITRREALATAGAVAVGSALAGSTAAAQDKAVKHGRLKQSVCRWCYEKIPLEEFCKSVAAMGLPAIDLLQPHEWEVAAKYGLICSTGYPGKGGGSIPDGTNRREFHDAIVAAFKDGLPKARAAKVPNLITFFGNRRGMSDQEALDNSVAVLDRIKPMAEDHQVTVVVELLNSKVNHPDYQGDSTPFGVQVMKAVNSPRIKLLYDIYHMQIMEGDVIRTIRDNHQYIGHYHTGGNPGRNEIDETQELFYPAIVRAIVETGYTGYLGQEFVPLRDPLTSLREAVELCDV